MNCTPQIDSHFNWQAHHEFLIFGTDGELLGETDSMTDAIRIVHGNTDLHLVTWCEDGYPVVIAKL